MIRTPQISTVVRSDSCFGPSGETCRCDTVSEIALFFVVFLTDRSNKQWSGHKYRRANCVWGCFSLRYWWTEGVGMRRWAPQSLGIIKQKHAHLLSLCEHTVLVSPLRVYASGPTCLVSVNKIVETLLWALFLCKDPLSQFLHVNYLFIYSCPGRPCPLTTLNCKQMLLKTTVKSTRRVGTTRIID